MAGMTWLHLSDLHQQGKDFDEDVVRDALLKDIQGRASINPNLSKIDFLVFSGDVAFSGQPEEYNIAREYFINPLLEITALTPDRLLIVPGNHDLDRRQSLSSLNALPIPFTSESQVSDWFTDTKNRLDLLRRFAAFERFASEYAKQDQPAYASIRKLEIDGKQVALFGLNSALMSWLPIRTKGEVTDYGNLVVGEPQVDQGLSVIASADLRIAVLHHPFDWIAEFDRNLVEERLEKECQFILCGHWHEPNARVEQGKAGSAVIIPAGSIYDPRATKSPRFINSYNFVHIEFETEQGTIYLRRWSDRRLGWVADIDSYRNGELEFRFLISSSSPTAPPSPMAAQSVPTDTSSPTASPSPTVTQSVPTDTSSPTASPSPTVTQSVPADTSSPTASPSPTATQRVPADTSSPTAPPSPTATQNVPTDTADGQAPGISQTAEQKDEVGQLQPVQVEIAIRALADKPSEVDLLEFNDYAEALVDFIENENTEKPLTIVIDAPWGMGKSTLMGLIKTQLQNRAKLNKQRSFPMVWFNAWKYDQASSLWAALALEILGQVRKQFNAWQRFLLSVKLNMKRLNRNIFIHALLKVLPFILGLILLGAIFFLITWLWLGSTFLDTIKKSFASIGILASIIAAYGFVKDIYNNIKPLDQKIAKYVHAPNYYIRAPNYKEKIGFLAEFEEDFKLVVAAVTDDGRRPLIVFIDDLDRCAPPKPVEIIEAINILLDAKYCVFVIGMDSQTVAGSIEAKYKDLQDYLKDVDDPGGLTLGERFLEKIVQINFQIPRADSEVVKKFIEKNLKAKLSEGEDIQPINLQSEEVRETEGLIKDELRTGKPLDAAAQAVQKARPDIKVELVEQARQEVFAKTFDDSEEVKSAIQEAALYLGFNPRKIKRFINVFRLQALIANRRRLMQTGTIQLRLLAKWITIVTRWPDLVEAMLIDQNFLKSLKEAYLASEELSQSNERFLASAKGKKLQAKYDRYLANPHIKRLIDARDLMNLLKQMSDSETEALPQYLRLTQTTINAGKIEKKPTN